MGKSIWIQLYNIQCLQWSALSLQCLQWNITQLIQLSYIGGAFSQDFWAGIFTPIRGENMSPKLIFEEHTHIFLWQMGSWQESITIIRPWNNSHHKFGWIEGSMGRTVFKFNPHLSYKRAPQNVGKFYRSFPWKNPSWGSKFPSEKLDAQAIVFWKPMDVGLFANRRCGHVKPDGKLFLGWWEKNTLGIKGRWTNSKWQRGEVMWTSFWDIHFICP